MSRKYTYVDGVKMNDTQIAVMELMNITENRGFTIGEMHEHQVLKPVGASKRQLAQSLLGLRKRGLLVESAAGKWKRRMPRSLPAAPATQQAHPVEDSQGNPLRDFRVEYSVSHHHLTLVVGSARFPFSIVE